MIKVAILHPIDPAGHVPSGIDAFIRGVLKFAPDDLSYTLFGASSDAVARPVGVKTTVVLGGRTISFWPIVSMDATAQRGFIPLTIRYMVALRRMRQRGLLDEFTILDFHRIEPSFLFLKQSRPKNVLLHQDMSVIRDANSDILWRHAPWAYETIERRAFERMSRIFAVRQSAVERYRALYPQFSQRFSFIPTWVDSTVFQPPASAEQRDAMRTELRRRLKVPGNARVLVFVGRLDQQKDPLLLIEALKICLADEPDLHLAFIGDGVLRAKVTDAVRDHQMSSSVSFLGVMPPADIAKVLQGADLYVLCSAYEGMPIAMLEALATGLPVACTDVGEVRLVIRNDQNGWICESRTPASFAQSILNCLASLERLRGMPCEAAIRDYLPDKVLEILFANHRSQAAGLRANG